MDREKSETSFQMESPEDFAPGPARVPKPSVTQGIVNSPMLSILSYCGASILMTVTNKYVLSGYSFNLNFFLLMIQSLVCVSAIQICKTFKVITYRDFNAAEAKKCKFCRCN